MFRLACLFLVSACLALAASAGTKRALIVGVGDYDNLPDLQKTLGDADGYSDVFGDDLGFEVTHLSDPGTIDFLEALDGFLRSIEPGDEVAFIFSGHGWSDGADNFLALKDAPLESSEFALRHRTVSLSNAVLAEIRARKPAMLLAIVDACRDNPFDTGTRSVTRGMVRQEIVPGTLVVYAAGTRQKALDRLGPDDDSPYSVFTRSLLPHLKNPSVPLLHAIDETRDEVAALASSIEHEQRPAVYSDVSLSFCFAETCETKTTVDQETQDWIYISSAGYVQMDVCKKYSQHLDKYPDGKFAAVARRNLSNPPCAMPREVLKQAVWYADLEGHTDEVLGLDYSPSGRFLASASADNTARLWVVGMGPNLFGQSTVFEGHTGPVTSVNFSPDEEYIVTSSEDDTARIWRATGGEAVKVLRGHTGDVTYADFSPEGERVVTASKDGSVRVWEVATGEEAFVMTGHSGAVRSVHYSPLGNRIITASDDGTVRLWNASDGTLVTTIESRSEPAAYAESDATADRILVASADGTARIWRSDGDPVILEGHEGPLHSAVFGKDDGLVVTTAEADAARIWDAKTGEMLAKLQDLGAVGTSWAAFSPDATKVAVGMKGATLQLWELTFGLENPEEMAEAPTEPTP
ncbi:MAG: caspase family protein [Hyphomonas sp.]|uniref:caspase family protein n=1 Tax=Hyphomonas sp. TaxID=87 RepID=UPI003526D5A0